MLIHNVYFTLIDATEANIDNLVEQAEKLLKDDPGLVHFAVGKRATEFTREVNDQGYDVCLNTVFKDKEAHDIYQVSDAHKTFIAENKPNWKSIRVCDSYA